MKKIVVVESDFTDTEIEQRMAHDAGFDIAVFDSRDPDDVIANAADADGIITSYARFPARVFEALQGTLKVIGRTGVGYDNIDLPAATAAGVAICTAPGYGTEVVSDHAVTLALDVLRRTNELDADMRAGNWGYAIRRPLGQVHGRTFGVVGMGEIGRATARKAAGLGFAVICCSRSLKPGRRTPEGYPICTYEDLLTRADVVSFHTALTPETHHMLDAERLALMKSDAVVVNTSRGAIIDTLALSAALKADRLWGAGIDVFEEEPVAMDHPLLAAPHTVLTPHVAYWSEESGVELRTRTAQSVIDVLSGKRPLDCLNPQVLGADETAAATGAAASAAVFAGMTADPETSQAKSEGAATDLIAERRAAAAKKLDSIPIKHGDRPALERVAPHIFRIDLPVPEVLEDTNSYLVTGGERALIIDCGCNLPQTEETFDIALAKLNIDWADVDVFLTHSDFDHCAGLTRIWRDTMTVYSGMTDYNARAIPIMGGEVFAENARRISEKHGCPYDFDRDYWAPMRDRGRDNIPVRHIGEGDVLAYGDYHFRVIETPGHDAYELCLYDEASKIMVTGDHVLGSSYPSTVLSSDDDELQLYLDSLDRLLPYDVSLCLDGHGSEFTDLASRIQAIRAHYDRQLDAIRELYASGITDVDDMVYAFTQRPRRKPWEERPIFGKNALVGQTMTYLEHLVTIGEFPDAFHIVHK